MILLRTLFVVIQVRTPAKTPSSPQSISIEIPFIQHFWSPIPYLKLQSEFFFRVLDLSPLFISMFFVLNTHNFRSTSCLFRSFLYPSDHYSCRNPCLGSFCSLTSQVQIVLTDPLHGVLSVFVDLHRYVFLKRQMRNVIPPKRRITFVNPSCRYVNLR